MACLEHENFKNHLLTDITKKLKSLLTRIAICDIITLNLLKCVDGIIPFLNFICRELTVGASRYERKGKSHSGAELLKM